MKTFLLTLAFFGLRAFKPEFFENTTNTVLFTIAFVVFVGVDLVTFFAKLPRFANKQKKEAETEKAV